MQRNLDKPPYSNTGVQNTDQFSKRALIDWVSGTFQYLDTIDDVVESMGLEMCQFVQGNGGKFGYRSHYMFGHIFIYYEGNENMGIHVEMSGQGCREFELLSSVSWEDFISSVLQYGKLSRLDVAVDEFEGILSLPTIKRAIRDGRVVSRFKKTRTITECTLKNGNELGNTIYFGRPSSALQVRFYDKYAERVANGKEIEEGVTHWVRVELQMRNAHANNFALVMIYDSDNTPLGAQICGVLKEYIRIASRKDGSNRSRWPIAKYWTDFLDGCSSLKISPVAPDRTIERIHSWLEHQAKKSIATLFSAYDDTVDFVSDWIERGIGEMTEKEWMMIYLYQEKKKAQGELDSEQSPMPRDLT